jgi:hypothetical protein
VRAILDDAKGTLPELFAEFVEISKGLAAGRVFCSNRTTRFCRSVLLLSLWREREREKKKRHYDGVRFIVPVDSAAAPTTTAD